MTRIALYAQVSTSDKDQNTETQLMPLRDYAQAQGLDVYREYVDEAGANDINGRKAWRRLLDDAAKRKVQDRPRLQAGPGLQVREAHVRHP